MSKLIAAFAAVVALAFNAPDVRAQEYPSKPIRIVLPSASGGLGDTVIRLVGQKLTERVGQNVILDNKPGAGGVIGMQHVIQSPPDGYTMVMGYIGVGAVNQFLYTPAPYDTLRDFVPVAGISTFPSVLLVRNDLPAKDLREFIAYAKANPGKLTYASAGTATSPHLITELLKRRAGIDLVHVPYKGAGPAMIDFMAGRTDVFIDSLSNARRNEASGKYRILGITTGKRSPLAPEIPTLSESGLDGFEAVGWFGMFAPAGTPAPVVDKLSREITAIIKSPDIEKQFRDRGMDPMPADATEFRKFMTAELDKWGRVVREAGIKAE